MKQLKLALMDMNNGAPNQGFRGLRNIAEKFKQPREDMPGISVKEYEVRQKHQIPGMDYDIYITSGGPGDPTEHNGSWVPEWFRLIDQIWRHNQTSSTKKHVFFVCYSFQMACYHFGLGDITKRKSTSFGIFPIHKTEVGKNDILLQGLMDPYYAVDSRDWQLVRPKRAVFKKMGASIISLEKIRTHVEYERAIMAIRFSPEMVGTQFHPEADPEGMKIHFELPENKAKVVKNYSERKYRQMMASLDNPETIKHTHKTIIPGFLRRSIQSITKARYNDNAA